MVHNAYLLINFFIGVLMWTLLGRAVLSILVGGQRSNFVYRFFCNLTDWYMALLDKILPEFLIVRSLFLVQSVIMLLVLRILIYLVFYNFLGYRPTLVG